ncbi:hypothetical protein D4R20_03490 [bacterium]|nr:MAG: hypothetical protein D4R20_03490 [bacterium]
MLLKNKIFLSLFILIQGCGLFGLREAQIPVEPRSNFIPPTSPEIVLTNLIFAVTEKDVNNYMQCFVDSAYSVKRFSYTADVTSQIQYPVFMNWQLYNERTYFNNLLALTQSQSISALNFSSNTVNLIADTAIFDSDYELNFNHQKTTVAKTLKGKIRLIMSSDSRNLWSVHRWIDFRNLSNDTTWSVLKANFSN